MAAAALAAAASARPSRPPSRALLRRRGGDRLGRLLAARDLLAGRRGRRVGQARLQAGREVAQQAVGDVLHHAGAAEAREAAGDREVGRRVHGRGAVVLGERVDDRRRGAALAALVGAARRQRRRVRALVGAVDLDRAAVGRGGRPELDLEAAVVGAVVVVVGDRRARGGRGPRARGRSVRPRPGRSARRCRRTARASRLGLLQPLRRVDVGRVAEPADLPHVDVVAVQQRAGAGVAVELGDVVKQPPLEQDGVPGRAVVGRAHGEVAAAVVEHPGDRLGADEGLVAERDDRGLDVAQRGGARLQSSTSSGLLQRSIEFRLVVPIQQLMIFYCLIVY